MENKEQNPQLNILAVMQRTLELKEAQFKDVCAS